jgi:hypothetical protein
MMPGFPVFSKDNSGKGRKLPLTSNRTGLIGEMLFGRNIATSRVNSAGLKANGFEALTGNPAAPVYGDHQIELGNGAGLDTGISSPLGAQTILIACSPAVVDAAAPATSVYSGSSLAVPGRLNINFQAEQ